MSTSWSRALRFLLVAAAVSVPLLAPLLLAPTLTSATQFADQTGVTGDTPMLVQGVDVAAVVLDTRDTASLQAEQIGVQQARLGVLRERHLLLRTNLTDLDEVVAAQARLLQSQYTVLDQQAELIRLLQEYAANNTARLNLVESTAAAQDVRTSLGEATTIRLDNDVSSIEATASALNSTVAAQEADLTQLDSTTAAHADEIVQLRAVDAAVDVELAELVVNATALASRVTDVEFAATALNNRVTSSESTAGLLTDRVTSVEANAATFTAVQEDHTAKLAALDPLTAIHAQQLDTLEADAATTKANVATLQQHDRDTQTIIAAVEAAATALRARVASAENLTPTSSSMVDAILDADSRSTVHGQALLALQAALLAANASIVKRMSDEEAAVAALTSRTTSIESTAAALQFDTYRNVTTLLNDISYVTGLILNFKTPKMYRYVFLTSGTWVVPAGVSGAFVTMAGGGGTGYGWRIANAYQTGPSGGYVFSQPVKLVAGETITVTVGGGAIQHPLYWEYPYTGVDKWHAPLDGFSGLYGEPGKATVLTSPSNGELLRCAGGAGMSPSMLDTWSTDYTLPDLVTGGTIGSGRGTIPVTVLEAEGPYNTVQGPGACGNNQFGIGNEGMISYLTGSVSTTGAATPFGYGSGGGFGRSGCYVSAAIGQCNQPSAARDGVVFIDVMY